MGPLHRRDAPFEIRPWPVRLHSASGVSSFGDAEQETALGPLTWLPGPLTSDGILRRGEHMGDVYMALRDGAANGKPLIPKVGMTGTFARRMQDARYVARGRKFPGLRFHLAQVRGRRGDGGIGGVVQMVALALARLLRRARVLIGRQLPYLPVVTAGPVRINNALPKALEALLAPALAANPSSQPRGRALPNPLVLKGDVTWEAEGPDRAATAPWP